MFKKIRPKAFGVLPASCMGAALLVAFGSSANAATTNTTFNVSANVAASCSVSATALAFGAYNPSSTTALTQTSTITLNCTKGTAFTVALDAGQNASTGFSRRMIGATNGGYLNYQLYTNNTHSTVWGDGSSTSTSTVTGTGTGPGTANQITETVYGQIPSGQNVSVDSYSDTIQVTLTY